MKANPLKLARSATGATEGPEVCAALVEVSDVAVLPLGDSDVPSGATAIQVIGLRFKLSASRRNSSVAVSGRMVATSAVSLQAATTRAAPARARSFRMWAIMGPAGAGVKQPAVATATLASRIVSHP